MTHDLQKDNCTFDASCVGATCSGHAYIETNEEALKTAVHMIGPISVAIDADETFLAYTSGIFVSDNCMKVYPNHAVLVVGYGREDGHDYWIVKNRSVDDTQMVQLLLRPHVLKSDYNPLSRRIPHEIMFKSDFHR